MSKQEAALSHVYPNLGQSKLMLEHWFIADRKSGIIILTEKTCQEPKSSYS